MRRVFRRMVLRGMEVVGQLRPPRVGHLRGHVGPLSLAAALNPFGPVVIAVGRLRIGDVPRSAVGRYPVGCVKSVPVGEPVNCRRNRVCAPNRRPTEARKSRAGCAFVHLANQPDWAEAFLLGGRREDAVVWCSDSGRADTAGKGGEDQHPYAAAPRRMMLLTEAVIPPASRACIGSPTLSL
jgi:hypothetical protein